MTDKPVDPVTGLQISGFWDQRKESGKNETAFPHVYAIILFIRQKNFSPDTRQFFHTKLLIKRQKLCGSSKKSLT